jgi:hypothetical protein
MNAVYIRFDDRVVDDARACLNSLRTNWPGHPPILADYAGTHEDVRALLNALGATTLAPMHAPAFTALLPSRRDRSPVFDRFKLWLAPLRAYGTILHLDADTLVLGPLDDLLAAEKPVFVANHEADPAVRVFTTRPQDDPRLATLLHKDGLGQFDGPDDMVNAGVFAIPRRYRAREELARLAQLTARYAPWLAFADQSLLSIWLRALDLRPTVDFRFNYQTPFLTDPSVKVPFDDVRVFHFSSHRKPGTPAFTRWNRVGAEHGRLLALYARYRDMPAPPESPSA